MAEKTTGIYKLITLPKFYVFFQSLLGGDEVRDQIKSDFFPDVNGKRILEVGCGPGIWASWFKECDYYLGLDWNAEHIRQANKKWGSDKFQFEAKDVRTLTKSTQKFDFVIAFGLLHHLEDEESTELLAAVSNILSEDGQVITIDPVFHDKQNLIARLIKKMDSGKHIRKAEAYKELVPNCFSDIKVATTVDMLRIPYSHFFMTLKR